MGFPLEGPGSPTISDESDLITHFVGCSPQTVGGISWYGVPLKDESDVHVLTIFVCSPQCIVYF